MKVLFTYKNGQQRSMDRQQATILQLLGHGQFLTTEAAQAPANEPAQAQARRRAPATTKAKKGQA